MWGKTLNFIVCDVGGEYFFILFSSMAVKAISLGKKICNGC